MPENNVIKSITVHTCPHCTKEIYIESQMIPSTVNALFTAEMVEVAKKDCIARVETLDIDEEKKKNVIKWLSEEGTIFGPNETESIILSLLKPEE